MEKRAKPNRGQIGLQKAESSEMRRKGCRKKRERTEVQKESERARERERKKSRWECKEVMEWL